MNYDRTLRLDRAKTSMASDFGIVARVLPEYRANREHTTLTPRAAWRMASHTIRTRINAEARRLSPNTCGESLAMASIGYHAARDE